MAIAAPSGAVDPVRLAAGIAYLEGKGHPCVRGAGLEARLGYLAGPDEDRAGALNDLIAVDASPAIAFARGGYGMTRIVDQIDLEGLRRRPRLLIGYSDATALFMALQRDGPYMVHYGPVVSELGNAEAFDPESLWATLYGRPDGFTIPFSPADVLRPGRGAGPLIGGCLSLLVTLLGTRHDPDYDGAILFWEEVGEAPFRIDRMLAHLRNAGKFDRLRGMVIGSLTECRPPAGAPSLEIRRIVLDLATAARFPIVWNVRAGHIGGKRTLPLGLPASLNTSRGTIRIRLPRRRGRS